MISQVTTPQPLPQTPTGVKIVGLIDASEEVVEPWLAARVDSLEKAKAQAGSALDATVQVHRAGVSPTHKLLKGIAIAAAHVAAPVIGFAVGGPLGAVLGGLGALLMAGTGTYRMVMGEIASAKEHRKALPDPEWSGMRRYNIVADKGPGTDSTETVSSNGVAPDAAYIPNLLAQNMDPIKTNIFFVAGHGMGYRSVAGMSARTLAHGMEAAARQAGRKTDVLLMESCLMGNMEAMNELKDSAHVAVVSEETIQTEALPLQEMLVEASRGGTPQEIGKRMLEVASKDLKADTLSVIDLDKMPALMTSLDTLGKRLSAELDAGHADVIQASLSNAQRYPQGSMLFMERAASKFADLGSFISGIDAKSLDPATQTALQDASQKLNDAVLAKSAKPEYAQASGLSFQMKNTVFGDAAFGPKAGKFGALDLPQGWREFINRV